MENMLEQLSSSMNASSVLRPASASACGKAIIVGEHAVVYGARAVAMPLREMRMQIEVHPAVAQGAEQAISMRLGGKEVNSRIGGVVTDALNLLKAKQFSLNIQGKSNVPFGAGLGSSATLCIVVLRALAKGLGLELNRDQIAGFGNALETRFHGSPSGLDTAVVAYEECVAFAKQKPIESIPVPTKNDGRFWQFALIDSGVRASTLAMINLAAPYFRGSEGERKIAQFDEVSLAVAQGLLRHDLPVVKEALQVASRLLDSVGVVTSQLKEIMERCAKVGVLASKSTGAGGGGAILTLLDPTRVTEQLEGLKREFGADRVYAVSL